MQEFLGRLTLGHDEKGLDSFHLATSEATSVPIAVADVHLLEKRTTRAFHRTLFGSLLNTWLIDSRCVKPDRVNGFALAILPRDDPSRVHRLWSLVQETCPLPLLPHWRTHVLDLLRSQSMLTQLPSPLGPVEGYRIALDVPTLTDALGELIRSRVLDVTDTDASQIPST
jgi:hypothetical protein